MSDPTTRPCRRSPRLVATVGAASLLASLIAAPVAGQEVAAPPADAPAAAPMPTGADELGPGEERPVVATRHGQVDPQLLADVDASGRLAITTTDQRVLTRTLGDHEDVAAVVDQVRSQPGVATVEADHPVTTTSVTFTDPEAWRQWDLPRIGADVTQAVGHDGRGVVIAVLDTGVQATHPDLAANVLPGYDAITSTPVPVATDVQGHGTMVAGTAAAIANTVGGRGVAHAASILPVKVLGDDGSGWTSHIAAGIDWATDNGADVINLSLAGPGNSSLVRQALARAVDHGIVVVASTGNEAQNGNPVLYPAANADTIAVGASRSDDRIASFSSFGDHVTVAAPGQGLYSTRRVDGYTSWSGTSAAAPVTSAVLATAIAAAELDLVTRADIETLTATLIATADDAGTAGWDPHFGHGIVRVDRLVEALTATDEVAPEPEPTTEEPTTEPAPDGDVTPTPDPEQDPAPDPSPDSDPAPKPAPDEDLAPTPQPEPAPEKDAEPAPEKDPAPAPEPKPAPRFRDVPTGNPHLAAIDRIRTAGVTAGCTADTYCPADHVTRGQMATFLARALGLPLKDPRGTFRDVPTGHPHARAIEALARAGITGGCGDDRYCPGDDVSRDQMATFLTRGYRLPVPADPPRFSDVRGGPHAANIAAVATAGITRGCGSDRYCPGDEVRRDQMASFLARAMDS